MTGKAGNPSHSSAHLMAEAIESLYPGTRFGIGPCVDTGFYYDIDLPEGKQLSEKELENIEKKMMELSREKNSIWSAVPLPRPTRC